MHVFKLGAIYSLADVAAVNNADTKASQGLVTEPGLLAVVNGPANYQLVNSSITSDTSLDFYSNFEGMEF